MLANSGTPLSELSGSGATRELHETIRSQIVAMDKQSAALNRLTVFMAILAFIQTVATLVQIIPIVQGWQDVNATSKLGTASAPLSTKNGNASGQGQAQRPAK